MANYANEYAEPNDIARKEGPVTKQNVSDAYDQLMFIKVVSLLLANQDNNSGGELDICRMSDLGRLFFFLAGQPSDVLGDLNSDFNDDDADPDPGKEKPILTSIDATNHQAVEAMGSAT